MSTASVETVVHLTPDRSGKSRSLWQDALLHFLRDRLSMAALIILLILTLICVLGPPILENALQVNVTRTSPANAFLPPGTGNNILGTDHLGRDQLIRLMYGGRISLAIASVTSTMIIVIGVSIGLLAGFFGGVVDDFISWLVNTVSAIPLLFLLIIIAAIWQPGPEALVLILALLSWVGTSRLVRAEVLTLRERDFVMSARALGASRLRLLVAHILPNLLPIVIVTGSIIAGNLILLESGLSYLGIGIQPPIPTWGNMLTDARSYLVTGVHLIFYPGLLIMITVMCFYLVGDGLRDALDPYRVRLASNGGA